MKNLQDWRDMCYNAAVSVEQRLTDANPDGNNDVGIAEPRVWLELVWHEWRKQVWRDRIEHASAKAWTAPERIDAPEIKAEKGGSND